MDAVPEQTAEGAAAGSCVFPVAKETFLGVSDCDGGSIPNDGRGLGLQASVDAWLNANKQPPSDATI